MTDVAPERVLLDARRHGIVLAGPLLRALALAAGGGLLLALSWPFSIGGPVLLAGAAALALWAVWRWERTRVVVTSEKVFLVQGTWRRSAKAVRLGMVDAVEIEQSLPGQLLGYGTVVVGPLELEHVPEPRRICQLVERLAL